MARSTPATRATRATKALRRAQRAWDAIHKAEWEFLTAFGRMPAQERRALAKRLGWERDAFDNPQRLFFDMGA